jgi:hypothetical protein
MGRPHQGFGVPFGTSMPTGHWVCRGAKAIPLGVDLLTARPITPALPVPLRMPLGCNVRMNGPPPCRG